MKKLLFILLGVLAMAIPAEAVTYVTLETSVGDIKLELYEDKAPITVKNFVDYVNQGHYDGTVFHRVIDGFMIQGGGYEADFKEKETAEPIKNEAANGLKNSRGTIAMARTNIPDSATSQFFINLVGNDFLDYKGNSPQLIGYAVFGKVIEGMNVVDMIGKTKTTRRGSFADVPATPIVIKKATVTEK